ncbi:hypothetical protein KKA15_04525 [Patescibacteria group bacterium]|nr:hypothetical protein [Patescibacteria group bacterium]
MNIKCYFLLLCLILCPTIVNAEQMNGTLKIITDPEAKKSYVIVLRDFDAWFIKKRGVNEKVTLETISKESKLVLHKSVKQNVNNIPTIMVELFMNKNADSNSKIIQGGTVRIEKTKYDKYIE